MRRLARAFDASDITRAAPNAPPRPGRLPGYYRRRALHWARVSSLAQVARRLVGAIYVGERRWDLCQWMVEVA